MRPPTLKVINFEALRPTDLIFLAWKDLIPFPKCTKIQESDSILRFSFVLSKTPHLHRAYLVTIHKRKSMTVCIQGLMEDGLEGCGIFSKIETVRYKIWY